jgi:hypothetical protein|tara:strand:- start:329 stop:1186 length:858 start_codon:yes stop_codon:yes gene_type:complete
MRKFPFLLPLVVLFFGGCNLFVPKSETTELARVGSKYLYLVDVKDNIPIQAGLEDSLLIIQESVNKWIEQELLVQRAELNLGKEALDIDKQLQDYRNSLVVYSFEKEFVNQKLDTVVGEQELLNYYQNNTQNFELRDYVVKVLYVKVEKNAPHQKELSKMLTAEEDEELRYSLEDYCRQFATNFMLENETWLYFNDLLKEIPIKTFSIDAFLKKNSYLELEDENFNYFLSIKDFRLKDSVSPFELESNRIKSIILNKRKLDLLSKMRKNLFQDALSNNQIEYFNR